MYESDLADKKNTSTQYEELMRMIYNDIYISYIIIYLISIDSNRDNDRDNEIYS